VLSLTTVVSVLSQELLFHECALFIADLIDDKNTAVHLLLAAGGL